VKGLKKLSYAVDPAYDGQEALMMLEVNTYDLVILDLNLPLVDGLEVLRQFRVKDTKTKVLILSAKNTVEDKISGLDLGANDYLEKPFDFLELAARTRNLLRWSFTQSDPTIRAGRLTVDTSVHSVLVDQHPIGLTNKEYAILEYLLLHRSRFVPTEEIIEHVWDYETDPFSNTFKYHMHSLKKKLGVDGIIVNTRGKGYKLCEVKNEK